MGRREREAKRLKGADENTSNPVNAQLLAIKRLAQAGPRRIGPYSSQHTILLVGEGDFSLSRAIASAIGGDRLTCTSLDKSTQLQVKYDNRVNGILGTLHGLGAKTHHNVDATKLEDYEFMREDGALKKFSRIIFNFPCVGLLDEQQLQVAQERESKIREQKLRRGSRGKAPTDSRSSNSEVLEKGRAEAAAKRSMAEKKMSADKELLSAFFLSAKQHLADDAAQIHITLRRVTVETVGTRAIEKLAQQAGLTCQECRDLRTSDFPGYLPQQTHPKSKGLQPLTPGMFFSFRIRTEEDVEVDESEEEAEEGALDEEEECDGRGVYSEDEDSQDEDVGESDEDGRQIESRGREVQVGLGKRKGGGVVTGADSKGSDEAASAKKKRKKKKNKASLVAATPTSTAAAASSSVAAATAPRAASGAGPAKKTKRGKKKKQAQSGVAMSQANAAISYLLGR